VTLLEPYDEVEVLVLDDLVGEVMSDLSSRRRPAGREPRCRQLHQVVRALRADG
jgi:translation elongation factor EF-G